MSTPTDGPCAPWPVNTDCCATEWETYTPEQQTDAVTWASYILWAATGRRFGTCPVTVRPCGAGCVHGGGYMTWPVRLGSSNTAAAGPWIPYVDGGGTWRNCACPGSCSCSARCQVLLPGPVSSITEVTVDAVIVDPSGYRVDNLSTLVRTDGECWPTCQDFNVTGPAEGTFEVVYERGTAVPLAGQIAAGKLACDYAKSCATGCVLPGNLSSLTRQGTEVTMVDPTEVLQAGLTGIHEVDLFIQSANPYRLRERSRLYSPDISYPRVVQ